MDGCRDGVVGEKVMPVLDTGCSWGRSVGWFEVLVVRGPRRVRFSDSDMPVLVSDAWLSPLAMLPEACRF